MLAEEIRRLRRTPTPEERRAQTRERVRRFRERQRVAKRVAAVAVLALALLQQPARAQQLDQERATARACEQAGAALAYSTGNRKLGARYAFDCRLLAPLPPWTPAPMPRPSPWTARPTSFVWRSTAN
jgi:hypothetical protein